MSFICQACGKNQATIHITENPYDKAHKKEIHLCDDCAKEKGGGQHPVTLPVMLESLLASQEGKEAGQAAELACPNCGMTFSEFRSGGRLGCPEDYTAFKKALMPFLEKIHGSTRHTGKSPTHIGHSLAAEQRIAILQKEMEKAIGQEEYERAADLRDRIRELKEKKDGAG